MSFDRFVALDWSGARQANGIAIAVCEASGGAPRLIAPPNGRRWTREQALAWVAATLGEGRALIGFDFAFALPFVRARRYFEHDDPSAMDLWALVERDAGESRDLWGGHFVADPRYAPDFWCRGTRPGGYVDPHRAADLACRAAGMGIPESPYKLIGAKQVGLGALAGMRLLHRLQARAAIWPFTATEGRPVLVEIYPRLFLRRAGFGSGKVRSWSDLAAVLAALGSDAPEAEIRPPSDHDTDALVSAAGLRALADQAALWDAPRDDIEAMRRDGWIFGVPAAVRTGTHGG